MYIDITSGLSLEELFKIIKEMFFVHPIVNEIVDDSGMSFSNTQTTFNFDFSPTMPSWFNNIPTDSDHYEGALDFEFVFNLLFNRHVLLNLRNRSLMSIIFCHKILKYGGRGYVLGLDSDPKKKPLGSLELWDVDMAIKCNLLPQPVIAKERFLFVRSV